MRTAADVLTDPRPTKPVDLDALEKLHAAATQGEWQVHPSPKRWILLPTKTEGDPNRDNNAEFVAAAHNALPALIAELRELRELVGMATVYELRMATVRCVPTRCGDECEWYCERDSGSTTVHATLPEALAAARKWEADHAV